MFVVFSEEEATNACHVQEPAERGTFSVVLTWVCRHPILAHGLTAGRSLVRNVEAVNNCGHKPQNYSFLLPDQFLKKVSISVFRKARYAQTSLINQSP